MSEIPTGYARRPIDCLLDLACKLIRARAHVEHRISIDPTQQPDIGWQEVASREWILIEQTRHHGRIKVGAYAYDYAVLEIHDPAVTVSEPHTVLGRGQ